jgi:hypothetical protein
MRRRQRSKRKTDQQQGVVARNQKNIEAPMHGNDLQKELTMSTEGFRTLRKSLMAETSGKNTGATTKTSTKVFIPARKNTKRQRFGN